MHLPTHRCADRQQDVLERRGARPRRSSRAFAHRRAAGQQEAQAVQPPGRDPGGVRPAERRRSRRSRRRRDGQAARQVRSEDQQAADRSAGRPRQGRAVAHPTTWSAERGDPVDGELGARQPVRRPQVAQGRARLRARLDGRRRRPPVTHGCRRRSRPGTGEQDPAAARSARGPGAAGGRRRAGDRHQVGRRRRGHRHVVRPVGAQRRRRHPARPRLAPGAPESAAPARAFVRRQGRGADMGVEPLVQRCRRRPDVAHPPDHRLGLHPLGQRPLAETTRPLRRSSSMRG